MLFNGAGKSLNVPYKMIQFNLHTGGLEIEKDARRDQCFLGSGDLELFDVILETTKRLAAGQ